MAPHLASPHFSVFSTALWDSANSRPVHSLILSSHLFFCPPCRLRPFTVPCKMVLARPDERETCPYHCVVSLRWSGGYRLRQRNPVYLPSFTNGATVSVTTVDKGCSKKIIQLFLYYFSLFMEGISRDSCSRKAQNGDGGSFPPPTPCHLCSSKSQNGHGKENKVRTGLLKTNKQTNNNNNNSACSVLCNCYRSCSEPEIRSLNFNGRIDDIRCSMNPKEHFPAKRAWVSLHTLLLSALFSIL